MRLVMLGPPGAGKGTQARRLADRRDLAHIETGEMLRTAISEQTELGRKARQYVEAGDLVPDSLMISLIRERIDQPDARDGFILDGFPRTLPQADALEEELTNQDRTLDAVLYIRVSREEIVDRLSQRRVCENCGETYHLEHNPPPAGGRCGDCGGNLIQREDDRPEAVENRLSTYEEKTRPLLSFYRERDLLVEIDGEQPIQQVTQSIQSRLESMG